VTGDDTGSLWGTDVYTDDSSLATAAVHAGVLHRGETGIVKVQILPGRSQYEGTSRHGVVSRSYGAWGGSYRVSPGDGNTHIEIPPALEARPMDGDLRLSWNAEEDHWRIESSGSIMPPVQWEAVQTSITIDGAVHSVRIPISETMRFFRIVKE